jgi:hypothetical protein
MPLKHHNLTAVRHQTEAKSPAPTPRGATFRTHLGFAKLFLRAFRSLDTGSLGCLKKDRFRYTRFEFPAATVISEIPRTKTRTKNKIPLPAHLDEFWYTPPPRLAQVFDMGFREDPFPATRCISNVVDRANEQPTQLLLCVCQGEDYVYYSKY